MSHWGQTIGHFISPLTPHRTWQIRGKLKVLRLESKVSFLIPEIPGDVGSVLKQPCLLLKRVFYMSVMLAQGLLLG